MPDEARGPASSCAAFCALSVASWHGAGLVICDVWDTHWCRTARSQAEQLAPRINDVAREVRQTGGVVIHTPSQTEPFYERSVQYLRARAAATRLPIRRPVSTIAVPRRSTCPCKPSCPSPRGTAQLVAMRRCRRERPCRWSRRAGRPQRSERGARVPVPIGSSSTRWRDL